MLVIFCSGDVALSVTNSTEARDAGDSELPKLEAGLDVSKMAVLTQRLESGGHPNLHMVLVEHRGELVYEKYLSGGDQVWGSAIANQREFDRSSLHGLFSVTKSVTSLLLGIALGDEFEAALERPILDYFPEYADRVAEGAQRVTLYHVLTMTAGFAWNEMTEPYTSSANDGLRMFYAADPVEYVLTRPLSSEPGESWYYNGGMTMVLAALTEKLSGRPLVEFAFDRLFKPLGISEGDAEWHGEGIWRLRQTLPAAADGLRMKASDLSKIGVLVLNRGEWRGQQIVPEEWVHVSTRRQTEQTFSIWSRDGIYGYGFHWWPANFSGEFGEFSAIAAVGHGGQRLFIIPEKELVVTIFAGNFGNGLYRVSEQVLAEIVAAAP